MASDLSPLNEQFIEQALAAGEFVSRDALLDIAVERLRREAATQLEADLRLADEAIDQLDAGLGREYGKKEWQALFNSALEQARAAKNSGST